MFLEVESMRFENLFNQGTQAEASALKIYNKYISDTKQDWEGLKNDVDWHFYSEAARKQYVNIVDYMAIDANVQKLPCYEETILRLFNMSLLKIMLYHTIYL